MGSKKLALIQGLQMLLRKTCSLSDLSAHFWAYVSIDSWHVFFWPQNIFEEKSPWGAVTWQTLSFQPSWWCPDTNLRVETWNWSKIKGERGFHSPFLRSGDWNIPTNPHSDLSAPHSWLCFGSVAASGRYAAISAWPDCFSPGQQDSASNCGCTPHTGRVVWGFWKFLSHTQLHCVWLCLPCSFSQTSFVLQNIPTHPHSDLSAPHSWLSFGSVAASGRYAAISAWPDCFSIVVRLTRSIGAHPAHVPDKDLSAGPVLKAVWRSLVIFSNVL